MDSPAKGLSLQVTYQRPSPTLPKDEPAEPSVPFQTPYWNSYAYLTCPHRRSDSSVYLLQPRERPSTPGSKRGRFKAIAAAAAYVLLLLLDAMLLPSLSSFPQEPSCKISVRKG
jgi:hypothetical protein